MYYLTVIRSILLGIPLVLAACAPLQVCAEEKLVAMRYCVGRELDGRDASQFELVAVDCDSNWSGWKAMAPIQVIGELPNGFDYDPMTYRDTTTNKYVIIAKCDAVVRALDVANIEVHVSRGGRSGLIWSVSLVNVDGTWVVESGEPIGSI